MDDDAVTFPEKHSFHPTDPPHGLKNVDLGALSKDQQRLLNKAKMRQRIENEIYLKGHPEIRGLISILLKDLLQKKPMQDVHETIGVFFTRPRGKIIIDLLDYFTETGHSGCLLEHLRKEIAQQFRASSNDTLANLSSSLMSFESPA